MRSPVTRHPSQSHGFTLLEILVVTVIIGIGLSLVIANLQPDDSQAVRRDAYALAGHLERLQERALYGGQAIGVTFGQDGPQTWMRDANGQWAATALDAKLRTAVVPVERFRLGATPVDADARMVFLPDGMNLPFELTVGRNGHRFVISGDPLGRIAVKSADA